MKKDPPLFSLVIFPTPDHSKLIKSWKQLLKSKIEWFNSANSVAHITIIQFENEMELALYIDSVREFCKTVVAQNVTFDSFGKFEYAGAFFIAPNTNSKMYLDNLIVAIHKFIDFKINPDRVNAHMSIARKLHGEKMKTCEILFKNIDVNLKFCCDAIYVRKFNEQSKQYSEIIEKISFEK